MKIGMLTAVAQSSRGDVEPYVALAKGLQRLGHRPRLVCEDRFEPFVRAHGIECFAVRAPDVSEESACRRGGLGGRRRRLEALVRHQVRAAWEGCRGTEALVFSGTAVIAGCSVAERLGVPYVPAFYDPMGRTGAFPNPWLARFGSRGPAWNRATHRLAARLARRLTRRPVNRARREILGLPERGASDPGLLGALDGGRPVVYGYSASFLPRPDDWPASARVTGYWFLEQPDEPPPPDLAEFLDHGEPPVCVALGRGIEFGIRRFGPDRFWALILEALRRSGCRGVIVTGAHPAPDAATLPGSVCMVPDVPYGWLFPRVAAVVHHAGAGTTGAALRSGRPSVPVPAAFDQFFWADRLARSGAGTLPVPLGRLSAARLCAAIQRAAADPRIAHRAGEIGAGIRAENGVAEAARLIDLNLGAETTAPAT